MKLPPKIAGANRCVVFFSSNRKSVTEVSFTALEAKDAEGLGGSELTLSC